MKVTGLGWMGTKTRQFDSMITFSAGIEFIYYPEPQRASGRIWQHFRAPDGNVYEIIGNDVATELRA